MKYQTIFSALFFASSFADAASDGKQIGEPKCVVFDKIKMAGGTTFVDTEGSFPSITTGDMTIGEVYTGVQGVPTQYGSSVTSSQGTGNGLSYSSISQLPVFEEIAIAFKSVCIVTKDQHPPVDTSSPTCFYEFDLGYCPAKNLNACRNGRFTAHGSGPGNLQITGGNDDFFGAFGQIKTPNPFDFDIADIDPVTGDLAISSIDMIIELCFYDVK